MTEPNPSAVDLARLRIWIISTGTEILQGLYLDTNAQWISQQLLALGFRVERIMALPDDHDSLKQELAWAADKADLIFMTGGLGPTADDMNRQTVADVFGVDLREDAQALLEIEERFSSRGRPMPPSNRVQALVPEGATVLYNEWGTAPGFYLRPQDGSTNATMVALPGPPRENRPMFSQLVEPLLLEQFAGGRKAHRLLTFHTVGLAESHVNDKLSDLFGSDPKVNLALLAGKWRTDVRLTLQGANDNENDELGNAWRMLVAERLGSINIYGEDDETFEAAVGDLLRRRGETLALAESCTGGMIAARLTDVPGASEYFIEGFVTYSNEAKMARLGVPADVLEEHGAVSAETAEAMAAGARKVSGADWALSITGIAGPGGGTEEKPVGLVYVGLAMPDGRVKHRRLLGPKHREAVRELSTVTALNILRRGVVRYGGTE